MTLIKNKSIQRSIAEQKSKSNEIEKAMQEASKKAIEEKSKENKLNEKQISNVINAKYIDTPTKIKTLENISKSSGKTVELKESDYNKIIKETKKHNKNIEKTNKIIEKQKKEQREKDKNYVKSIREKEKERNINELAKIKTAQDPKSIIGAMLSWENPFGLTTIVRSVLEKSKGKKDKEIAKSLNKIQEDWVQRNIDTKDQIIEIKGTPIHTGKAIEGGILAGITFTPAIGGATATYGTYSASAIARNSVAFGGEAIGSALYGQFIGNLAKNHIKGKGITGEEIVFAVMPIIGTTGIKAYSKMTRTSKNKIINKATEQIKDKTKRENAKKELSKALDIASDYAGVKTPTKTLNIKGIKALEKVKNKILIEKITKRIIKKNNMIVGGSASSNAQTRITLRQAKDLDVYGKKYKKFKKEIINELKKNNIKRVSVSKSGDITIEGNKFLQAHPIEMLKQNLEPITPFYRRRLSKNNIILSEDGIKLLKLSQQAKRKAIGSFEMNMDRYSKDMPDFRKIIEYFKKEKKGYYNKEIPKEIRKIITGKQKTKKMKWKEIEIKPEIIKKTKKKTKTKKREQKYYNKKKKKTKIISSYKPKEKKYNTKPKTKINTKTNYKKEEKKPYKIKTIKTSYPIKTRKIGKPDKYKPKKPDKYNPNYPRPNKTKYPKTTKNFKPKQKEEKEKTLTKLEELEKKKEKRIAKRRKKNKQFIVSDPIYRLTGKSKYSRKENIKLERERGAGYS